MRFSANDHRFMAEALRLAQRGRLTADPNPAVGCVIVAGDEPVGRGWHRSAGEPHAETLALQQAGERARGSSVYVTLEPCSHQGRTPPCVEALVDAGVAEVITAMTDPDPRVSGAGHARLARTGIRVRSGLMEAEARELNPGFISRNERGRPWVRVKLAVSVDGRTAGADGQSRWITSPSARADVQYWRARSSCILTGIGTVLADNPRLNLRLPGVERTLLRVVVDSAGRLPADARLFGLPGPVIVASLVPKPDPAVNAEWWQLPGSDQQVELEELLRALGGRGVNSVQVEAGPTLSGALMAAGLVDELLIYQAACVIGPGRPMLTIPGMEKFTQRLHLTAIESRRVGPDWRHRFRLIDQPSADACSPE
ncbi:MAG: bifunctional diaminohydroxyphosphoribosylaminopyrimidine deaminase/5-amino-6-(5-phosphoribosylamino)uracil reductase RibD [Pseudomonadota bacterium]|nr:MAG: bifunctional diaminohydroxyphosphoribosylaminopyrimidine deaminase/5-amino-6-(5-phosphoribosylamino)uracil reductase RibD [Pseudomonadota bacterium]